MNTMCLGIDPHEVRGVPLAAPFHQDILDFLYIRAGLPLDVEDVSERHVGRAVIREPAEKDLAVVQEDSLIFGGKLEIVAAAGGEQGREQTEEQEDVPA